MTFERLEDRVLLAASILNLKTGEYLGAESGAWNADGSYFAFLADEAEQDLNGDGDKNDRVVQIWNSATEELLNLSLDGRWGYEWSPDGTHLAILVDEISQKQSLNGDADQTDYVMHVWNAATQSTSNLELDAGDGFAWSADGGYLAFNVNELRQNANLNGDAGVQSGDSVMHVWKASTGVVTNTGVNGYFDPYSKTFEWAPQGDKLAILVSESTQGVDLNLDTYQTDFVLQVWDAGNMTGTNLQVAAREGISDNSYEWRADGEHLAVQVNEFRQGGTDLDGDGGTNDDVLHVWDAAHGLLNLETSSDYVWSPDGDFLTYFTYESLNETDLNGDTDDSDYILTVWDAAARSVNTLGIAIRTDSVNYFAWSPDGRYLASLVNEYYQDIDLNGGGFISISSDIVDVWDSTTDTHNNLGFDGFYGFQWSPDSARLAIRVYEAIQGDGDLNGDLDDEDIVLHVWTASTDVMANTGVENSGGGGSFNFRWSPDGQRLAIEVYEGSQGGTDLNLDGDTNDDVLHVWSAATGDATNLGIDARVGDQTWSPDSRQLSALIYESPTHLDLNSDGDQNDDVLFVWDAPTGILTNTHLDASAGHAWSPDGRNLAFVVSEFSQDADLNGDGGANLDDILHVWNAASRTIQNLAIDVATNYDWSPAGDRLSALVYEGGSTGVDLNNNGQTFDDVMHIISFDSDPISIGGGRVILNGSSARITGTSGDDVIIYNVQTRGLVINGVGYVLPSTIKYIELNAAGGNDRLTLYGSAGNDKAVMRVGTILLDYLAAPAGFDFIGSSVETIFFNGNGGSDEAFLDDSAGDDVFTANPHSASMVGPGFANTALNVHTIAGRAINGGDDKGFLIDSTGNDDFSTTLTAGNMVGSGYFNQATGFEIIDGRSQNGGIDRAFLQDSPGDDDFGLAGGVADLSGPGFFRRARNFATVSALALNGGVDHAVLRDTSGNDTFVSRADRSFIRGGGLLIEAVGFENVAAQSTVGGTDAAYFYDGAGADTFTATSETANISSSGLFRSATGFDSVAAYAINGGIDAATLFDSVGVDTLDARPGNVNLFGSGYFLQAQGFEMVTARSIAGGVDRAFFTDGPGADAFYGRGFDAQLTTQIGSGMTSATYVVLARQFESVSLDGTHGGANTLDIASLAYLFSRTGTWTVV